MNTFIYLFFICIFANEVQGQTPLFKNLCRETDFATNTVYDMYQAKNGVVWVACDEGLIRHSGANTDLYIPQNTTGKAVSNIMEGANGTIWCQNFSGQYMVMQKDSLQIVKNIESTGNYKSAVILNYKILVCCTNDGILLYDTKTNITKKIRKDVSTFLPFIDEHNNTYKLFSNTKKEIINIDSNEIVTIKKNVQTFDNAFFATTFQQKEILFSKNKPIVFAYHTTNIDNTFRNLFDKKVLNNIKQLDTNALALLTSAGFYLIDKNLNKSELYLPFENTSCIMKDINQNIWIGTLSNGIYIIPNLKIKKYYAENGYNVICNDGNNLALGSNKNSIQILNTKDARIIKTITDPIKQDIKSIYKNPYNDELLYSNYQLNFYNKTKITNTLPISVNAISMADPTHYLLSESGAISIYPITKKDKWRNWLADNTRRINNNRLIVSHENSIRAKSALLINDTIYASTGAGLYKYFSNGHQEIKWKNKTINCLQLNTIGDSVLIATSDVGILLYVNGKLSSFINTANGLLENDIYIVKIYNDSIYVLLYSGLDAYDKMGKKVFGILRSDGFINVDVADFVIKNNMIFCATTNGLISFPLAQNMIKNIVPQLLLNKISINQQEYIISENIQLNAKQKNIEIEIEDLDYLNIQPNKLFYKINDGEWIPFKNNKIGFNEMAYGSYEISFKAVTERGTASINNPMVMFTINAPYYRTWWFISLALLGFVVLMLFGFKYRIAQINIKNKLEKDKIILEKALHKSTLASIKSQMNPHFIFNALNTIQSYIYMNDKKTAGDYLVTFSELTRLILDSSNQEKIDLAQEIKTIQLYLKLEKMRFEEDFNYEINTSKLESEHIKIPSMLIQPYIENAIKHGLLHKEGKKILLVNFEMIQNVLTVTIDDNGIGIEASEAINKSRNPSHQSFATKANQKRFELLNEINANNIGVQTMHKKNNLQQATGTKIILSIPL